jgi:hypothetical protein
MRLPASGSFKYPIHRLPFFSPHPACIQQTPSYALGEKFLEM